MTAGLRVVYRGNFQPSLDADREPEFRRQPWSTETHVGEAWELAGHEVIRIQEDTVGWPETIGACETADLFLWTSTWGFAHGWDQDEAHAAVEKLNGMLPTMAWHLDKFFDLPREDQLTMEPWFRLGSVWTADGGNQDRFAALGINHHWLQPAVHETACTPGRYRPEYASDVVFVGNWRGGYHPEWAHREALVEWLKRTYDGRIRFWPRGEQIRGQELCDLYASCKVAVGDSCLVGDRGSYVSDRVPETVGRGCLLLHPFVQGVIDGTDESPYRPGEHLDAWDMGDWDRLRVLIDHYLSHDDERQRIAEAGRAHVLANHTYTVRVRQVLETVFG